MPNFSEYEWVENNQENFKNSEKVNNDKLEDMINKYSQMSEDKLLSEFMKLTYQKKRNGELNKNELENIKSTIEPFLNFDQKNKLNEIIDMVSNV